MSTNVCLQSIFCSPNSWDRYWMRTQQLWSVELPLQRGQSYIEVLKLRSMLQHGQSSYSAKRLDPSWLFLLFLLTIQQSLYNLCNFVYSYIQSTRNQLYDYLAVYYQSFLFYHIHPKLVLIVFQSIYYMIVDMILGFCLYLYKR